MKRKIRLNESELRNIIVESVRRILREAQETNEEYGWIIGDYSMGLDADHPFETSENVFKSKDEALNDGIEHLVKYKDYCNYGHTSGLLLFKSIYNNGDNYTEMLKEPLAIVEWDGIRIYKSEGNGESYDLINL